MLPAARARKVMVKASFAFDMDIHPHGVPLGNREPPIRSRRNRRMTMVTIDQAKAMAKHLRNQLAAEDIQRSHSACLEITARQLGFRDWNTAAAQLPETGTGPSFTRAIPILRIFDEAKAREFYLDFLGFTVEFEHRFGKGMPLYMGVMRAGLILHLSAHHGDATPGSTVFVPMTGIKGFHRELLDTHYGYNRPGLERAPWGQQVEVHDPFGNRIRFCEYHIGDEAPDAAKGG